MKKKSYLVIVLFLLITSLGTSNRAWGAPPLMDFEGVGGGGILPGAYLVNPPQEGQWVGKPAITQWSAIGGGSDLLTQGFAFTLFNRLEVGYMFEHFDCSRIRDDLRDESIRSAALGLKEMDGGEDTIYMHVFHIKALLFKESKLFPAFAIGAEFKFNDTIDDINKNLGGALSTIGYDTDHGVDFDISISKTIPKFVPYPLMIHSNIRFTKAVQTGLLGFSDDYKPNFEIGFDIIPQPNFMLGFEYRMKPDEYSSMASVLKDFTFKEDDLWDIHFGYLFDKHLSLALAFASYGNVANQDVNYFVANIKYDF